METEQQDETSEHPRCCGCGYSLRGLDASACPECGRGYDLDDPSTYQLLPSDLMGTQRLCYVVRRLLWAVSVPGVMLAVANIGGFDGLVVLGMVVLVVWFLMVLVLQTYLAATRIGGGYSLRHAALFLLTLPTGIGAVLVPLLVIRDVERLTLEVAE